MNTKLGTQTTTANVPKSIEERQMSEKSILKGIQYGQAATIAELALTYSPEELAELGVEIGDLNNNAYVKQLQADAERLEL